MGLFGQSTGFDGDVEKATSETNTNENWSLILDVCDKVNANSRNAKDCLKSIMKRMGHTDPHISMQAITLLDACVSNCGKTFHLEIASREFQNEFKRLLGKVQPKVAMKMRQVLKSWAENEFKTDPELNLIPSLYNKLRQEGYDFSNLSDKPKSKMSLPKDPNVVSSQQEEDDLAKAIELSLKETKGSPKNQANAAAAGIAAGGAAAAATSSAYPSLYPSVTASAPSQTSSQTSLQQTEPRKVRALYDFEAAEENELTFFAGEMLHVLDDSDPNWWKGQNQRGEGLFPSNFVSADLSIDPERLEINQQHKMKKSTQFEEDSKELQQKTEAAAAAAAEQKVEIDEPKVDRLLYLLNEANPEDPSKDTEEMLRLEQEVHQMGPLIDAELERVDRKHAELSKLSSDLVDAINLYHSLMKDDRAALGSPYSMTGAGMLPAGYAPQPSHHMMPPAGHMMYGGAVSNPPFVQAATGGYGPQSYQGPMSTPFSAAPTSNFAMGNIPMNYQNGHMNSQLQQRIPGMQQLPHAQMSLQHPSQQHPQQQQQQPQLFPAASMPNGTAQPSQQMNGNGSDSQQQAQSAYQMLQQSSAQHQQQQQNQQFVVQQQQQPVTASNHQSQQQQAPQQFMSPQHQNQTQPPAAPQQHIPFMNTQTQPQPNSHFYSNGPAPQQFPTQQPNNQTNMPSMAPPQPAMLPPNSAATLDQFGQLQHQMANLGIGSPHAASLPYQPNIQQNIPIYQQQR